MITIPTSNSWWIFDDNRMLYRRIPRDMNPKAFVLNGEWETYSDLELDADNSAFTVFLNSEKTRIMRGYIDIEDHEGDFEPNIAFNKA